MSIITTDPIADMLTRIRNAIMVRKTEVSVPHSKSKEAVAKLLVKSGFVDAISVNKEEIGKNIVITLNSESANSPITEIVRMSRPGRRQYVKAKEIPIVKRGRGIVLVSTSQGVMTGAEAKKKNVGGELICKVY